AATPFSSALSLVITRLPPLSTLFPYTTLFRSRTRLSPSSSLRRRVEMSVGPRGPRARLLGDDVNQESRIRSKTTLPLTIVILTRDRKSTRLNSSHVKISYAVFCLKKKNIKQQE